MISLVFQFKYAIFNIKIKLKLIQYKNENYIIKVWANESFVQKSPE